MNKIYLIQGLDDLVKNITILPQERVNLDHIVATVALKYPELWPPEIGEGPLLSTLECKMEDFTLSLYDSGNHHCILAEYANTMEDRGKDIRIVNGNCLSIKWLQHGIIALHKNKGNKVINIHAEYRKDERVCYINGEERTSEVMLFFENWSEVL